MDQISLHPLVLLDEQFLSSDECAALAALARNDARLSEADIPVKMDETGRSAELPLGLDPLLATVAERIAERLGLANHVGHTLRMRHYMVGQGHPPHVDSYTIDGHELIATGIVCVCAPELGGETVFPDAEGGVLAVVQAEGQLVAWHNLHPDGTPNPAARHLATPVESGEKIILSWFIYGTPVALLDAPTAEPRVYESPSSLPGLGRMLVIVDDGVPAETVALMRASAEGLGVRVCIVDPDRFDFDPERQLRPGDLMYRPAVSMHAMRTEQHLWRPDIGSFYEDPEGPLFSNVNALETFRRAGLSVPRTRWISRMDRGLLRTFVDALGGFPLVLKMPGYSSGVGVMRVDSYPALFSLVEYVLAEGGRPLLSSFVDHAVHWRLVVVGDQALGAYRNTMEQDDFRTSGGHHDEDYRVAPPPGAAELAVRACHALRTAHGGVDILEHPSGRLYLLEANFPCYYPQAQLAVGTDIAGAMVDFLLAEAQRHAPVVEGPLPRLTN